MNDVRLLVQVQHGSHLYGTNTESSDQDFKSVHLPSARGIILQRAEDVIDLGHKVSDTVKNQAGDTDHQSFSLQKFLGMLSVGDTVATEILFAPPMVTSDLWGFVQENKLRFLNRRCKGFVGYCQRQAAKYGVKGSRMAAVQALVQLLSFASRGRGPTNKLGEIEDQLREFAETHEHASFVNIPSPNGSDLWHIECCDRKMPITTTLAEAYTVFNKVWMNYGERARAAMTNQGIDWKAISHAVRVARQAIELLDTASIVFPRPDAEELLAIKLGRLPYSQVSPMLEELVEEVGRTAERSTLPEQSDQQFIDDMVMQFYWEHVL